MKTHLLAGALLAACTFPIFAGTHVLLPPQAGDMVPVTLLTRSAMTTDPAAIRAPRLRVERRPVSISWALPHDDAVESTAQPFARDSREYWIDVSASELQRGIELPLTAPGALIRLSPSDPTAGRLDAGNVQVRLGRQSLNARQAASQLADAATLRAAGMSVPPSSMVLKLKPELGSGVATLQAPDAAGRYVVHVFEPQSPFTVTARADRSEALLGTAVHIQVVLRDADRKAPLLAVGGFLRAPDGSISNLDYRRQADGSFTTEVMPRDIPATPGLWEVHSFTAGTDANGNEVRRDTTTVFAAAAPTARFNGIARTDRGNDQGIAIALGVTTQGASRYAASAVLYGRAADGRMVPAAFAQSAAVLGRGDSELVLRYDGDSLHGVSAPYELRDLRLQDQPAVSLIERHALALRFDNP